jgi:hypothetical protein
MKKLTILLILTALLLPCLTHAQITAYFSPDGGCKDAVINEIKTRVPGQSEGKKWTLKINSLKISPQNLI